jgi:hypothetical protein
MLSLATAQIDDQGQETEGQDRQDDAQAEQMSFHACLSCY